MAEWPVFYTRDLIADDLLEIGDGYRAKNSEMGDSGLPFVRAGDVHGRVNTVGTDVLSIESVSRVGAKRSQTGDVVITTKGTVGRVAFVAKDDPEFVYSPQLCYWRSKERGKLLPRWLFYALQSNEVKHQMGWSASQTDMAPYLSLTDQRNSFYLTVPPISEQIAIAEILGSLDDKSDLNRRMNETLEAMARAIFKDWFVDFGPTRAKAEGRAPYLAPEIWDLFPNALDDDDKPAGWRHGKLDDLIVLQRGFDLPKPKRVEGKYPILAASGVNGTHHEAKVPGPGVSTGRSGVIGNVFYIYEDFWPLNTSLWVKKYRNSSPAHAYFLIQTLDFASFNSGSAVPTLNRNHVHNLPMAVPSTETIQGFDRFVSPLFQRKRFNDIESQTLDQTRDLLLPKLMSGEIRLTEAEKAVEAVA